MSKRVWICASVIALTLAATSPVTAQIEVEELGAAQKFAPGVAITNPLDAQAWSGTSASRATALLTEAPVETDQALVRAMLRRVVLSGLVPPQGAGEDFDAARLRAAQALSRGDEYSRFANRNAELANQPRQRADAAIASGRLGAACEISDQITDGRGETYWVRLRAACHEKRGETAAAELARDILRDRGESATLDIPAAKTGFWAEVDRLAGDDLSTYLGEIAIEGMDLSLGLEFDPGAAMSDQGERGSAQLYMLALRGDAAATAAFTRRAEKAGLDPDAVLDKIPAQLDPSAMATADLPLFARHAVAKSDIGLIQALYGAVDDDVARQRLALASDALGGGFRLSALGEGIDGGLTQGAPRARRDALIALALGAKPSEAAVKAFDDLTLQPAPMALIALYATARGGARAETLITAASLIEGGATRSSLGLYLTLGALQQAGFYDEAAQLAALDFLTGLDG